MKKYINKFSIFFLALIINHHIVSMEHKNKKRKYKKCENPLISYICNQPNCNYKTNNLSEIVNHKEIVHHLKILVTADLFCNICNIQFKGWTSYRDHIRYLHEEMEVYKCRNCNYATNYHEELAKHIKTIHPGKQLYPCIFCKNKTKINSEKSFSAHIRRQHSSLKCLYPSCNFHTRNENELKRHKLIHENTSSQVSELPIDNVSTTNKQIIPPNLSDLPFQNIKLPDIEQMSHTATCSTISRKEVISTVQPASYKTTERTPIFETMLDNLLNKDLEISIQTAESYKISNNQDTNNQDKKVTLDIESDDFLDKLLLEFEEENKQSMPGAHPHTM